MKPMEGLSLNGRPRDGCVLDELAPHPSAAFPALSEAPGAASFVGGGAADLIWP